MSRIGKKTIILPNGVTLNSQKGGEYNGSLVSVAGPKGELSLSVRPNVTLEINGNEVVVNRVDESKESRAFHGLYRTLINNMVVGVSEGYKKELEIVGIGYRAEVQGTNLVLSVGYSHKITYVPPKDIKISVADQTNIIVEGPDKQVVGEVSAKIRAFRKPEPYKGKGIRYKGEKVRKKSTKSA